MFINDLTITIPSYYVKSWGEEIIKSHNKNNFKWEIEIDYESPKDLKRKKFKFTATLSLSFIKGRNINYIIVSQRPEVKIPQ